MGVVLSCIQPSYLPWRGYFHIVEQSDVFVFYDDVQYTKQDWRNRNVIKGKQGLVWLTVPVVRQPLRTPIHSIAINNATDWGRKHWHALQTCYGRTRHFGDYAGFFRQALTARWTSLAELDIQLTEAVCGFLGIDGVRFLRSSEMALPPGRVERLVAICQAEGATEYLSGPSARGYMDEGLFARAGIAVRYMEYNYPPYPQLGGSFEPQVSIVDLLFNCGRNSPAYIW